MKQQINNKIIRIIFTVLLAAFVFAISGCITSQHPDPLAGWQVDFNEQPNQTIVNDYQNYIQQLPPDKRRIATVDDWLKDGTGQHAIKIRVGLNGTVWEYVLIYDKNNKRIMTTKKHHYHPVKTC
jgi:hypothetical protein